MCSCAETSGVKTEGGGGGGERGEVVVGEKRTRDQLDNEEEEGGDPYGGSTDEEMETDVGGALHCMSPLYPKIATHTEFFYNIQYCDVFMRLALVNRRPGNICLDTRTRIPLIACVHVHIALLVDSYM